MKNIKTCFSLITSLLFIFISVSPVGAVYLGSGDSLNLPKEKKINETAFIAGNSLNVDSDINGDLFCAGRNVAINGNIKGDVLCAGQVVKINGTVDGNVRVTAQNVEINGTVSKNVTSLSQTLTLAKFSTIKGDLFFGVQNIDLRGSLGRDIGGGAEQISISGSLIRNALVAGSKISVIDPAKIGGSFEYYLDNTGTASVSQKNIKGNILKHEIIRPQPTKEPLRPNKAGMIIGKIFWLLSSLILGFALIYFLKKGVEDRLHFISSKPLTTGLIGFAALILTPLAIIFLAMTIIGIPLAVVLLLEYLLSLMTASIYPLIFLGGWALKKLKYKTQGFVWPLITGLILGGVLMLVPIISFFAGAIYLFLGLGSIFLSYLPKK